MTSYSEPTDKQVRAGLARLSSPQHEAYFFSRLENPKWIEPLAKAGAFRDPPGAQEVEEGRIRFPPWPPSRYLARMATEAPGEVIEVLQGIETDNTAVIVDIIDAALNMPSHEAAALVPVVGRAAEEERLWFGLDKGTDLCVHLVKGGEEDAAMRLAKALFTPRLAEGERPRLKNDFWYTEGLEVVVPLLSETKPLPFLYILRDWLKVAVEARPRVDSESGADFSCFWRPAVEEHNQNRRHDFASLMVGFVRAGFEKAIDSKSLPLRRALEILRTHPYLIFKRLRLHLITEFSLDNPELARKTMMDRSLFDDFRCKHEYARLVGQRLDILSTSEREEWFGWIDAGPDLTDFENHVREQTGREATEEERQNKIKRWKYHRLHWVRDHLDGERAELYQRMRLERGEPQMADLNVRMETGLGNESPLQLEELVAGSFKDAVESVASWRPRDDWGPTIEDLGRTFQEYVRTNPGDFSTKAQLLVGKPAIFVRRFLVEMAEAVKKEHEIALSPVLELCEWVVEQPVEERTTPKREWEGLLDPDWQWTRDEVSRFVEYICKAKREDGPRYSLEGFRDRLWALIEKLCHDKADSYVIRDISEEDPRVNDYLELGLNSPRGKAVEAGLEYARWVANHVKSEEDGRQIVPGGFDVMPEVREELEWQLAPENRSVEAFSVIGAHVRLLYWIDKEWLASSAEALFDLKGIEEDPVLPYGWAAWNALLMWVRPHVEFLRLFEAQYAYAVEQAAMVELPSGPHQPMYRLGEHLMVLYWSGHLSLDDETGLLRRFLETANPDARRFALSFVGWGLEGAQEIPEEILDRLVALWDFYWSTLGKNDAADQPDVELFGPWFVCQDFEDQWRLERLAEFVEVAPRPRPDHLIVKELAEIAYIDLGKAVGILDRMIRSDHEGWRIRRWLDSVTSVLDQAIQASGEAQEGAKLLIDHLARISHHL